MARVAPPRVLQALAAHCARTTFFVNGEPLLRWPALARDMVAQGHTVGMHGFGRPHFAQLPPGQQLADLQAMQVAYRRVLGNEAAAYRFPFLEETATLRTALAASGITVFSVDAGADGWLPDQTPPLLADRLLQRLKEQGYRVVHLQWP